MAAFRPGDRFEHVRRASLGDARGRLGFEDSAYPQADYLRAARAAAATIQARDVLATEALQGAAIAERVQELRIAALTRWRSTRGDRSEEHTSELQSLMRTSYAVFCLKKNKYV